MIGIVILNEDRSLLKRAETTQQLFLTLSASNITPTTRIVLYGAVSEHAVKVLREFLGDNLKVLSSVRLLEHIPGVYYVAPIHAEFKWDEKQSKCIVFTGAKGGVGKTTLSILTSFYFASAALTVLVIDTDPGGSASNSFHQLFPQVGGVLRKIEMPAGSQKGTICLLNNEVFGGQLDVPTLELGNLLGADIVILDCPPTGWPDTKIPQGSHRPQQTVAVVATIPASSIADATVNMCYALVGQGVRAILALNPIVGTSEDLELARKYYYSQLKGVPIVTIPKLPIRLFSPQPGQWWEMRRFIETLVNQIQKMFAEKQE